MIDALRVNVVRESRALEEYEDEEFRATTLVKGKCVLDLLSQ
jgi:hypothetical protein